MHAISFCARNGTLSVALIVYPQAIFLPQDPGPGGAAIPCAGASPEIFAAAPPQAVLQSAAAAPEGPFGMKTGWPVRARFPETRARAADRPGFRRRRTMARKPSRSVEQASTVAKE